MAIRDAALSIWRRSDVALQTALAVALAVWLVVCATRWHPGFDELWHVWFGEIADWRLFWREVLYDTHPPTLALLTQALSAPGDSLMWARSISMAAAVLSPAAVFALARQCDCARSVAHLVAAGFAFSHSFVSVAVAVRSYALSNLFALLGLCAVASLVRSPASPRRAAWCAVVGLGCAGATTYVHALLPLVAVGVVVLLWLWVGRPPGSAPVAWRSLCAPAAALIVSLAAIAIYHAATEHAWVRTFIPEFLPRTGEPLGAFARAGFNRNVALFTGLCPVGSAWWPLVVFAGLWWLLFLPALRRRTLARASLLCLSPLLAVLLCVAGVLGKYPWGGGSRHQFVVYPPLVLLFACGVDEVCRRAHGKPAIAAVVLAAAVSALASIRSYAGPHLDDFRACANWEDDYRALAQRIAPGDVVHVHRFAQIGLYGASRMESGWTWLGEVRPDDVRCDRFAARIGGHDVEVLLDHERFGLPAASDVTFATHMARLMEVTGHRSLVLFGQGNQVPANAGLGAKAAAALTSAGLHATLLHELPHGAILRVCR